MTEWFSQVARVQEPGSDSRGSLMIENGAIKAFSLATLGSLLTRQELLDYQSLQLSRLVCVSYRDVPYYRNLFDQSGINPEKFRGLEDLESIPITSKRDLLREPPENIVSSRFNPAKLIHHRTNGSTGEPFVVRRTLFEDVLLSLFRLRALRNLGLRRSDTLVALRIPPAEQSIRIGRWLSKLRLFGRRFVDSTQLPGQIMKELRDLQPDVLTGLGGPVYLASRSLSVSECRKIQPRILALGGDTLTPVMIDHIQHAFQAPVFVVYGSHEFNLIASQCPEGRELHVLEDAVIVEILNGELSVSPGETGEVVVTNLHCFAQPFIRYRLGDIARRGSENCSCGSFCTGIDKIEGRIIDRIVLQNGQLLSPDRLFFVIEKEAEWVRQYQLRQPRLDLVQVKLVPSEEAPVSGLETLRYALESQVGGGLQVEIQTVSAIPVGPGGKLILSHSDILEDYLRNQSARKG